jgi:hypothetical protein
LLSFVECNAPLLHPYYTLITHLLLPYYTLIILLSQASWEPEVLSGGKITPHLIYVLLSFVECNTPFGSVAFDTDRVNMKTPSIFVQQHHDSDQLIIVAPLGMQTDIFIYPMPTWADRSYKWTLSKTGFLIAIICSFILVLIVVTVYIHRRDTQIRIFNSTHIIMFCSATAIFNWSIVLTWPADSLQEQCNIHLWVVYLSGSFLISIINMKAYRLSVFLTTSSNGRRPASFSHDKVLRYTMIMVMITAILLLIAHLADPPLVHKIVSDVYRPRLDYHECRTGNLTFTLLYIIVIGHFLCSGNICMCIYM